jgi:hypothetical protein
MMNCIAGAVLLSLLASIGATQVQPPNAVTHETTTTATVDRIERSSRLLTLRSDGNVMHYVNVDKSIKAFDDLRVGDHVTVRYIESVIVQVRPEAKLTKLQETTEQAQKGDPNVVQQLKRTVTIDDIDRDRLVVTYRTEGNTTGRHSVQNPALLEGLRRGDRIEITLTQARAVNIERRR